MPDKTLKSLKFPGLSGTYYIPQLANDYNEDSRYWYGCFCNYEGDVYFCRYLPEDEYSDDFITGPFNPNYWELISYRFDAKHPGQFANFIGAELFGHITCPYYPAVGYIAGQCVDYRGILYYCIRQTSYPAGQFDYNYWTPFYPYDNEGYVASAIGRVMMSQNYQNLLTQNSSISEVKQLDMDSISWNLMNQNPEDESEFEYAYCVIDVDSNFDYLISFPDSMIDENDQRRQNDYIDFPICFKTCIRNKTDINELMSSNPLFNTDDFKTLFLMENAVEGYNSEDYDYGQYRRIRQNPEKPFDSIIISVSSPNRAEIEDSDPIEFSDSQTEPISISDLDELSMFLSLSQLKAADSASTEQMFKLVQQDYTEIYKSLSDIIVEYDESHAYTDTKKIPLNEGNIALQFINMGDAWKDIDIELRVYSNKFGANESIKLKNSDKHIYIVDKNIGSNGELVEWDYFKLRFRYEDDYLSTSQVDFINSTLNILRKPKTQSSPNPINKNDPIAVQQFINLAKSFLKAEACYNINQPTFLETSCYYNPGSIKPYNIDASTFIHSCLRGLSFENTPYAIDWQLPPSYEQQFGSLINAINWKANTNLYSWAINSYEDRSYRWSIYSNQFTHTENLENSYEQDATSIFNECGALAKWMVDKGWRLDTVSNLKEDIKLQNIQPGDILFFAEQMGINKSFKFFVADMFPGYNYRNITHAGIVTEVKLIDDLVGSDVPYQYQITMISTPSILQNYLRQTSGHFEYDYTMEDILQNKNIYTNTNNLSHFMPAIDTFVLACRPDLSSHKKSYLELEAAKLGLHVIPENNDQLEIIKKCRACSDIEWSPSRNYDRPMPLTGNTCWPLENRISIDGQFISGVTYKGLPWSPRSTIINPEAFLSIIENENCPVYEDSSGIYPYYGWSDPRDFVNFIFENINFSLNQLPLPFGADSNFFDLEKIQLGQVIRRPAGISLTQDNYAAIITDYSYDELGNVNMIEVTEATRYGLVNPNDSSGQYGNLIRRKTFNLSEFLNWYGLETEISGSDS